MTPETIAFSVIACYAAQMTEKATSQMLIEFGIARAATKMLLLNAKASYYQALADGKFEKGTPSENEFIKPVLEHKHTLAVIDMAIQQCTAADHTGDDLRNFVVSRISDTVGDAGLALATTVENSIRPDYSTSARELLMKLNNMCLRASVEFPMPTDDDALAVYTAFLARSQGG